MNTPLLTERLKIRAARRPARPSATRSPRQRIGFTLIELLVVSILMTLVGMVVYNAFRQGFGLWQRVQYTSRQEQAIMTLDRIARELNNSFTFNPVGFKGEADNFYFPSLMLKYDWDWSNKTGVDESSPDFAVTTTPLALITKVTYQYDKSENTLTRSEEVYAYPDLDELKMNPHRLDKDISSKVILDNIDKIEFSYAVSRTIDMNFNDTFSVEVPNNQVRTTATMPYAVKIELSLKDMVNPLTRTIFLPISRTLDNE